MNKLLAIVLGLVVSACSVDDTSIDPSIYTPTFFHDSIPIHKMEWVSNTDWYEYDRPEILLDCWRCNVSLHVDTLTQRYSHEYYIDFRQIFYDTIISGYDEGTFYYTRDYDYVLDYEDPYSCVIRDSVHFVSDSPNQIASHSSLIHKQCPELAPMIFTINTPHGVFRYVTELSR